MWDILLTPGLDNSLQLVTLTIIIDNTVSTPTKAVSSTYECEQNKELQISISKIEQWFADEDLKVEDVHEKSKNSLWIYLIVLVILKI